MIIRKATQADIGSLCALEDECFSLPWSRKGFEDFFSLDFTTAYVAEDEGKILGYIGLYLSGEDADITNVAVTSSARRRGIGKALITAAKNSGGVMNLFLEVRESNLAARSLYESEGFVTDGKRKNFYQNPREDAILMSYRKGNNADTII